MNKYIRIGETLHLRCLRRPLVYQAYFFILVSPTLVQYPYLILEWELEVGSGGRDIWGQVQGVDQVAWINTRALICWTPPALYWRITS